MSVLCPGDEKQAMKGLHFQLVVSPIEREAEGSLRGEQKCSYIRLSPAETTKTVDGWMICTEQILRVLGLCYRRCSFGSPNRHLPAPK